MADTFPQLCVKLAACSNELAKRYAAVTTTKDAQIAVLRDRAEKTAQVMIDNERLEPEQKAQAVKALLANDPSIYLEVIEKVAENRNSREETASLGKQYSPPGKTHEKQGSLNSPYIGGRGSEPSESTKAWDARLNSVY